MVGVDEKDREIFRIFCKEGRIIFIEFGRRVGFFFVSVKN